MESINREALWQMALEKVRRSLPTEQERNRLLRYQACFLSPVITPEAVVIGVSEPIQVDLFTPLYAHLFEEAFSEMGSPHKVSFALTHQAAAASQPAAPALYQAQHAQLQRVETVPHPASPAVDAALMAHGMPSTMPLNGNYTFNTFVRGPSNSFAHAAATAVANAPGRTSYNPLFIYGGTGLGKTHLMEAIGHQVLARNPGATVCYITSETFLNEYVNALANDAMPAFRNRYRKVDVLLLDDVQFIAGKKQIQEEFFNTFNELMLYNKQVVMTSDVAPKDLKDCEERLTGRFQQGMVVEIESPSYETRLAILKFKAQGRRYIVPDEILNYIAEKICSHVRAIEGALQRVTTFMELNPDMPLNVETVQHLLKDTFVAEKSIKDLSINDIMQTVAKFYGVTIPDIISTTRTQTLVTPRQVAMFLARKLTTKSLTEIAKAFDKTHATIHHGMQTIINRMDVDEELRRSLEQITAQLGRNLSDLAE